MSLVHPQSPHREKKKNQQEEREKEKKRKEKDGARGKYQKRAMDRTGGFPTGLLCWFIWRSAMGFHCQSIRFEGGGRVQVIGLKRTGKSCRLRWVNYLHPGLKRGKMTPQEERLVLELHSKWGNRWSRIARKLPGRTDNEIKNFWRTHMRKVAQEKKKAAVHHVVVSPSSSSTIDSVPTIEIGEESFYDTGGDRLDYLGQHKELLEEEDEKGYSYSMDDIWRDIDDQSVIKPVCNEQFCSSNFSCGPVVSPLWEYGQYSPWKVAEEDNKLFAAMNIYDHGEAVALT